MFEYAQEAVEGALAAGAAYADARVVLTNTEHLSGHNGVVEGVTRGEEAGVGVRALIGPSWGFFATSDLTRQASRRAGAQAAASVRLAVAGHPAPLIVRADGSVETAAAHGTMLGAFPDPAFHTCAFTLAEGDAVVAYSDGILDALADGPGGDEERVEQLLAGARDCDAQALVDRMWDGLDRARLRDDVAIMALRRTT